jgi:predicted lysophospholipase L1 biosynthesis ABC-type transport system permease subunit
MGDGRRGGPPARSTLAACAVAVGAIAAALTFGASVRSLLDTPAKYGWPATVAIQSGGGYDEVSLDGAREVADLDGVEALTIAGFAPIVIDGDRINAIGIVPVEGKPTISVVRGRVPKAVDEVALGASTARDLGLGVGDELDADGGRLRVTGIVALPAIGPLASVHPSLGQGALLTFDGLREQDDTAYTSLAFLGLAEGLDPASSARDLMGTAYHALTGYPPEGPELYSVLRPAEVLGLQPASRTANLLAAMLAGAAVLALALTLTASVRRRAATYAVLSSLGFSRGEIRRTVRWHTNLVTLLAIAIGAPFGIMAGRLAWTAFADQMGAAGGPRVPSLLLAAVGVGLVVLANVVGEWPARQASRRLAVRLLATDR